MVKNQFANAGDGREVPEGGDLSLIPGLGRSPGEGNVNHSSILAWRIPITEGPGRLTVHGVAELDTA